MKPHLLSLPGLKGLFAVIFFVLALLFATEGKGSNKPDFDPTLQQALTLVAQQKSGTEKTFKNIKKNSRAEAERKFKPGYTDVAGSFNEIIAAIRSGKDKTADGTALETEIRNSVRLNRELLVQANGFLDETSVSEAWLTILNSSKTLDEKQKKKLLKAIGKINWKPWNEL